MYQPVRSSEYIGAIAGAPYGMFEIVSLLCGPHGWAIPTIRLRFIRPLSHHPWWLMIPVIVQRVVLFDMGVCCLFLIRTMIMNLVRDCCVPPVGIVGRIPACSSKVVGIGLISRCIVSGMCTRLGVFGTKGEGPRSPR